MIEVACETLVAVARSGVEVCRLFFALDHPAARMQPSHHPRESRARCRLAPPAPWERKSIIKALIYCSKIAMFSNTAQDKGGEHHCSRQCYLDYNAAEFGDLLCVRRSEKGAVV